MLTNIFSNINKESGGTTSEYEIPTEKWNDYYDILTVLNAVIIDIENVNKKAVKLYSKKKKINTINYYSFTIFWLVTAKKLIKSSEKFDTQGQAKVIREDKLLKHAMLQALNVRHLLYLSVINLIFSIFNIFSKI